MRLLRWLRGPIMNAERHHEVERRRLGAADVAYREAFESLAKIETRWPEVTQAARSMEELRVRNHFAESFTAVMTGKRIR